jgi:hypothetical protein
MLKKLILSGLTALMLIGFNASIYPQMGVAMYASNVEVSPNADMYAPVYSREKGQRSRRHLWIDQNCDRSRQ